MIEYKKGNIFEHVKNGMIVHGANAQGVMGSGVAKQLKDLYPSAYKVYLQEYKLHGSLKLGSITHAEIITDKDNLIIVNAVTQQNYGKDGKRYVDYNAVRNAFKEVNKLCLLKNIKDVHFPQIGAGLGGGDWNVISKIIEEELYNDTITKTCWTL